MKIASTIFLVLVIEFINSVSHSLLRPQWPAHDWVFDGIAWLVTVGVAMYLGWSLTKKLGFNVSLILKGAVLLWIAILIFSILIMMGEFLLGYFSVSELRGVVIGYLTSSVLTLFILILFVFIGSWGAKDRQAIQP